MFYGDDTRGNRSPTIQVAGSATVVGDHFRRRPPKDGSNNVAAASLCSDADRFRHRGTQTGFSLCSDADRFRHRGTQTGFETILEGDEEAEKTAETSAAQPEGRVHHDRTKCTVQ